MVIPKFGSLNNTFEYNTFSHKNVEISESNRTKGKDKLYLCTLTNKTYFNHGEIL